MRTPCASTVTTRLHPRSRQPSAGHSSRQEWMSSHPRNTRSFYLNLATEPSRDTSMQIQALARGLLDASPAGLIDVIPGYVNLLVEYDSFVTNEARLRMILSSVEAEASSQSRHVEIPVRYDGPDLESAAAAPNMTPDELVRRHSGADYLVHAIGFTPGFPYKIGRASCRERVSISGVDVT